MGEAGVAAYDLKALNQGNLGLHLSDPEIERRAELLLSRMSLEQKLRQMHGRALQPVDELYLCHDEPELGIPAFKMVDGPRGVRAGVVTTFPVAMARGATWDPWLERRVGEAIALEARARGANVLLAPAVNLLRHPGWGRAQETYGEDPLHVGRMAVGFIAGAQQHLIASVKHLAANSIENTRFEVDVTLDARTLHEIYLPHFRASVVDAHVGSVMTAYNKVNGRYCAENCVLLRDILRGQWGFRGFVESDWIFGTRSTLASLQAGLDIEMPHANYYGRPLAEALRRGDVPERLIDEAVRRILRTKLAFGLDRPTPIDPGLVECDAHMELALEVAHKSIVLLKNDGDLLPLPETADQRLCVVGSLSDLENTGDRGSSMVRSSFVTTPLAGIRDHLPGARIDAIPRDELAAHEHALVEAADAVVVVVGLNYRDEGENIPFNEGGGDRTRLRLSDRQEQLIREVTRLNPRTVVVMLGGSAIEVRPWLDDVPALLMAFYPGMLGGEAISDLVFGRVCPSGRLPISFAREAGDYPPFDPTSKAVVYGYHHGYAHLLEQQKSAELCFGFGLSYTRFSYGEPELSCTELGPNESVELAIDVTNVGTRSGAEVVQVYASYAEGPTPRPSRRLVTFGRVELEPGHTARLCLRIDADDLCFYDPGAERFVLPSGACTLFVARNVAEPVHARTLTLRGER